METRMSSKLRSSPLPVDYLKMVKNVLNTNFDAGIKALSEATHAEAYFEAQGEVYPKEIVVSYSLMQKGQMAATTVYASCDFDAKVSAPTIEDLLAACLDAAGLVFEKLLDATQPEQIERIAQGTLGALEDVPFHWTKTQADKIQVWVKIDKSNPNLDQMADSWLAKHDPEIKALEEEEQEETKKLFVTGQGHSGSGSGTIH